MAESDLIEFRKALQKMPRPLPDCDQGALCPWCGELHGTITYGWNTCADCGRSFVFGYPEWRGSDEPLTYVPFPHRAFDELGGRADLLEDWQPNERLQRIYAELTFMRYNNGRTAGGVQ